MVGTGSNSGEVLTYMFPEPCFQFAKSNVFTTQQANQALNATWNDAVQKTTNQLNSDHVLGDYYVKKNMTTYINNYLKAHYPGATFNPSGCGTGIPKNQPVYCGSPM
jgi:hypothetical protein